MQKQHFTALRHWKLARLKHSVLRFSCLPAQKQAREDKNDILKQTPAFLVWMYVFLRRRNHKQRRFPLPKSLPCCRRRRWSSSPTSSTWSAIKVISWKANTSKNSHQIKQIFRRFEALVFMFLEYLLVVLINAIWMIMKIESWINKLS